MCADIKPSEILNVELRRGLPPGNSTELSEGMSYSKLRTQAQDKISNNIFRNFKRDDPTFALIYL